MLNGRNNEFRQFKKTGKKSYRVFGMYYKKMFINERVSFINDIVVFIEEIKTSTKKAMIINDKDAVMFRKLTLLYG